MFKRKLLSASPQLQGSFVILRGFCSDIYFIYGRILPYGGIRFQRSLGRMGAPESLVLLLLRSMAYSTEPITLADIK